MELTNGHDGRNGHTINGNVHAVTTHLASSIIKKWGLALKFCMEKRGFSVRNVAKCVGVSEEKVLLWQLTDVPSREKLARLHGMMPQLRHFKHLIPSHDLKRASISEAVRKKHGEVDQPPADDGTEPAAAPAVTAAAPAPAPAPAPKLTFGEALLACRAARGWTQLAAATRLKVSGTALGHVERNLRGPSLETYQQILIVYPELMNEEAPVPVIKGAGGRIIEVPRPKRSDPPAAVASPAPVPTPPPVTVAPPPVIVVPEKATPARPLETLAVEYARALEQQHAASKACEDLFLVMSAAEQRKNAAEARAKELLEQLQSAAGGVKKAA